MSGPVRLSLRLIPDEPDQVMRLAAFCHQHPAVNIREGFGYWQACIPEPQGETVITRYTLRELLDKLCELLGNRDESGNTTDMGNES